MRTAVKTAITLISMAVLAIAAVHSQAAEPQKRVLFFFSHQKNLPMNLTYEANIQSSLQRLGYKDIDFYTEYMDSLRFDEPGYESNLAQFLHKKYAHIQLDLVVAFQNLSLSFLTDYSDIAFPNAPLIFSHVYSFNHPNDLPAKFNIGVTKELDVLKNVELAGKLRPNIKKIVVVSGKAEEDAKFRDLVRKATAHLGSRIEPVFPQWESVDQLMDQVRKIRDDAVIFYFPIYMDGMKHAFVPADVLERICKESDVPVYSFWRKAIGYGALGGYVLNEQHVDELTAEQIHQILNKEEIKQKLLRVKADTYLFDWRQLKKFGIREKDLPENSVTINVEQSIFKLYKWHILGALSIILLEFLFIFSLLVNRRKLNIASRALRESELGLRHLTGKFLEAQEKERERIAMELHDELGQGLVTLKLYARALEKNIKQNSDSNGEIGRIIDYIDTITKNVRRISRDLRPSVLKDLGLAATIQWLCRETSKYCKVEIEGRLEDLDGITDKASQAIIFRVFQEAFTNILKHADAEVIAISVRKGPSQFEFEIFDNGKGFNTENLWSNVIADDKFGLSAMKERIRILSGTFSITSQIDFGTNIRFTIPLVSVEND